MSTKSLDTVCRLDRYRISYLLAVFLIALVRLGCFPLLGDDGPDIVALLLLKCLVVLGCQEEEEKFVPIHPHLIQHWPITTKPAESLFADTRVEVLNPAVQFANEASELARKTSLMLNVAILIRAEKADRIVSKAWGLH